MKKNFAKRVLAMALVTTCIMSSVGCANSANATDVLMTVNNEDVTYGVANFYLRMQQGTYETYYSAMLGNDMWNQSIDGSTSFGESTVLSVVDDLKEMVILSQHAQDYSIALTDDEIKEIETAADAFIADNEEKTLEVMTADKAIIVDYLTLYTVSQRVQEAVKAQADMEVSDEEAAQRSVAYTFFSTIGETAQDGTTTELTDEEKATIKENAQSLADKVMAGEQMKTVAEAMGYTTVETSYSEDNTGSMSEAILETANALQEGQVGDVVEAENGYYVVQLVSEFDEEATEERKVEIVEERQTELYNTTYEAWKSESEVKEDNKVKEKLVINGTVTIKGEETTDDSAGTVDEVVDDVNKALSE